MRKTCWEEAVLYTRCSIGECHQDCVLFEVQHLNKTPRRNAFRSKLAPLRGLGGSAGSPEGGEESPTTTAAACDCHRGYATRAIWAVLLHVNYLSWRHKCHILTEEFTRVEPWHEQVLEKQTAHSSPMIVLIARFGCNTTPLRAFLKQLEHAFSEIALETGCATSLCGHWCCKVWWKQSPETIIPPAKILLVDLPMIYTTACVIWEGLSFMSPHQQQGNVSSSLWWTGAWTASSNGLRPASAPGHCLVALIYSLLFPL